MPFNSSGVFTAKLSYVQDKNQGIGPQAERFDDNFDDIAEGLSTTLCRDGQSVVSANIPFAGKKITYLGDGSADQDAVNVRTMRSIIASESGFINVKDPVYGAVGDGSTDDTDAIQAALTAAANKTLFFPPGKYILKNSIALVHAGCHVFGSGMGSTELRWASDASANGIVFTANASKQFHYVSDMTLSTALDGGTCLGFDYSDEIAEPVTDIFMTLDREHPRWTVERVMIAGAGMMDSYDPYQETWANAIFSIAALYATARDVNVVGKAQLDSGTYLRGTTGYSGIAFVGNPMTGSSSGVICQNGHPVVLYVENCNVTFAAAAVTCTNVEGIFIRGSNFIFGDDGVVVVSESGYNHPQLSVLQCHINNFLNDIYSDGQDHVNIQGCLLYQSQGSTAGVGVNIASGLDAIICGNQFESYGVSGSIGIQSDGQYGVISNNIFKQQGTHMDYAINLTAGSANYKGNMNVYNGTMAIANIADAGTGNAVT